MEAVNQSVLVLSRTGTVVVEAPLANIFGIPSTSTAAGSRVLYDHSHEQAAYRFGDSKYGARWSCADGSNPCTRVDMHGSTRAYPVGTFVYDCSGFATLCYFLAGADDPNGLDYIGQGYTGTLLRHMHHVGRAAAQGGDLVVWGRYPGRHVAVVLEAGEDPLLCSHGQENGPIEIRFSEESSYQAPPATWLSSIP